MNTKETLTEEWPLRPYYKRDLAIAYAPDITPASALNRLALWIHHNAALHEALLLAGYQVRQRMFTSLQVELICRYLGRP